MRQSFWILLAVILSVPTAWARDHKPKLKPPYVENPQFVQEGVPVKVSLKDFTITKNSFQIGSLEIENQSDKKITGYQVIWEFHTQINNVTLPAAIFGSDTCQIAGRQTLTVDPKLPQGGSTELGIHHVTGRVSYIRFADGTVFGKKRQ